MQFPVNKNWHIISEMLSDHDRILVKNKRSEIERDEIESRKASMTDSEKSEQAEKRKKMLEQLENDPHTFFGNMGQPETPQEFKNRYGVWPPEYDENGNKLP